MQNNFSAASIGPCRSRKHLNYEGKVMTQARMLPNTMRRLLPDDDVYATVLLTILIETYGSESFAWSPQTIREELEADFAIQELPKGTLDKIMAGISLLTTDHFYREPSRFIQLANILAGDDFDPTTFDPADSAECAWAIVEAYLLDPWDANEDRFAPEIKAYVGKILDEEGFVKTPKVLTWALRDNLEDFITLEYSDDPEMFQAIYEANGTKSADIDRMVAENLRLMVSQLNMLKLQEGSTAGILEKIQKQIRGQAV